MAEQEKEYLTLTFDDGEEIEYEVAGVIEVNDQDYIALIPETNDSAIEVYRLDEVEDDPDSEEITVIEDDEEYLMVITALREAGMQIEIDDILEID